MIKTEKSRLHGLPLPRSRPEKSEKIKSCYNRIPYICGTIIVGGVIYQTSTKPYLCEILALKSVNVN